MVLMNSLPTDLRDFVISSDNYTVDENGEVIGYKVMLEVMI